MQIAAYAAEAVPSSQYRAYQPMMALGRRGHAVELKHQTDDLALPGAGCELVYVARYRGAAARHLVQQARAFGAAVVWDCDDDILTSRLDGDEEARRLVAETREMLDLADVVTTTNDRLADIFLEHGARSVITLPNFLTAPNVEARRREHEGLVIGWIAWMDHQKDWDRLGLEQVFRELLDRYDDLHVESVGPIDLGLDSDRCNSRGVLLFDQLGPAIAGFDIGIAPLSPEIPANHSRSDIKLKEYAIAGVPWLASPIGPYAEMGEGQGGRLVPDDGWLDALDRMVRDSRGRRKLAKRGSRWARDHVLVQNLDVWEDMLYEAVELAAERKPSRV
jgi:glycosyltransferase involved in cell wall biosynthesis